MDLHHSLPSIPWTQNTESNSNKALRCVTIRQILRFQVTPRSRSFSLGMLMLVANVYRIRESTDSQGCWLGFDDGSGRIDGYKRGTEGDFVFEPFKYARIIGELEHRGDSDRKLLKIFHIEPVYEAHEIFHHLLRVIIETLISERGPPPVDHRVPSSPALLRPSQERTNHIVAALQEMSFSDDSSVGTSQNQVHISNSEDELLPDSVPRLALSILQADIVASISAHQVEAGGNMETGVHVVALVQEMHLRHPNITMSEFYVTTEQLLRERIIYNTIDDEHYACLSSENLSVIEHTQA